MKLARISLVAILALSAFSSVSFAKSLEEAVKNVDVSVYFRYRLDSDAWKKRKGGRPTPGSSAESKHKYRALINFKAPVAESAVFNLGVLYINENATAGVRAGNERGKVEGRGLGAGEDGDFGVSTYYMAFMPQATQTTINVGKQLVDTPLTNASDFDRGTGIVALVEDIPDWKFTFGVFDTFAPAEVYGYDRNMTSDVSSITKPLFFAGAIAKYGNLSAQLWGHKISKNIKSAIYANIDYNMTFSENTGAGISFVYARNEFDRQSSLREAGARENDLYKAQVDFNSNPMKISVGYLGNSAAGYSVALDSSAKGIIDPRVMGWLWWRSDYARISISSLLKGSAGGAFRPMEGEKERLKIFYTGLAWNATESVKLSATFTGGDSIYDVAVLAPGVKLKRRITEITPMIEYQHTKSLSFLAYYAMLRTKWDDASSTERRNRLRFQAQYRF